MQATDFHFPDLAQQLEQVLHCPWLLATSGPGEVMVMWVPSSCLELRGARVACRYVLTLTLRRPVLPPRASLISLQVPARQPDPRMPCPPHVGLCFPMNKNRFSMGAVMYSW